MHLHTILHYYLKLTDKSLNDVIGVINHIVYDNNNTYDNLSEINFSKISSFNKLKY